MATHLPFSRRQLRKDGLIDEKKFYRDLADECGYISPDLAEQYYKSLIRKVTRDLKKQGISDLPHLGQFAMVSQEKKLIRAGKGHIFQNNIFILKFYPLAIFREVLKRSGYGGNNRT